MRVFLKCLVIICSIFCFLSAAHGTPLFNVAHHKHRHPHANVPIESVPEVGSPEFWVKIWISIGLVLLGGVFSGLTLGLMGLDELHLRVLAASSESETERKNAKTVLGLLQKGRHWVLVVLLLSNVIVNESLPIFLDTAIGGGIAAVAISTTTIVIFGEIIPQAVSVRYGLSIGAKCTPLVFFMMYILAPVAYPIAKLLDLVLGVHSAQTYRKRELKSFLGMHVTGEEPLKQEELRILGGVLDLGKKGVEGIMTKIEHVVTMSADTVLDQETLLAILETGYSRIPIHEPGNPLAFVGLLLVKRLLHYDHSQNLPISAFPLSILPEAHPSISCFQALDYFQTGRAHLLLISRTPGVAGGAIGVVTLEDIIEEIISEEIVDETDIYEDNVTRRMARRMPSDSIRRGMIIEYNASDSDSLLPPLSPSCASTISRFPSTYTAVSTPTVVEEGLLDDESTLGLSGKRKGSGSESGKLTDDDIREVGERVVLLPSRQSTNQSYRAIERTKSTSSRRER